MINKLAEDIHVIPLLELVNFSDVAVSGGL